MIEEVLGTSFFVVLSKVVLMCIPYWYILYT